MCEAGRSAGPREAVGAFFGGARRRRRPSQAGPQRQGENKGQVLSPPPVSSTANRPRPEPYRDSALAGAGRRPFNRSGSALSRTIREY